MAEITEKIYPIKTIVVDHIARSLTPTQGPTAPLRYSGWYHGDSFKDEYGEYRSLQLLFDLKKSPHASTRRIKPKYGGKDDRLGELNLYILSRSFSMQGDMPPETVYDAALTIWKDVSFALPGLRMGLGSRFKTFAYIQAPQYVTTEITKDHVQVVARPDLYKDVYSQTIYTHQAEAIVDLQTNRPYLSVIWEDVVPEVRSIAPGSSAFMDNHKNAVFTWRYEGGRSYTGLYNAQAKATLEWRVKGSAEVKKVTVKGEATQYTIPADTFPEKAVLEWRICVVSQFGPTAEMGWQEITTTDALPAAPSALRPNAVRVDNNVPVTLSWVHTTDTGTAQSAAMVEYSKNYGASWQTLGNVAGAQQNVEIAANRLPAGAVWWRVKTANTDGEYGPWSEPAQIIVRSVPRAPTIRSVSACPRPVVEWQSEEQQGYRVRVEAQGLLYDTGSRYGGEKRVKCPMYLPEGKAQLRVEISNRIGLSNHTEVETMISNTDPETPRPGELMLSANAAHGMVRLRWQSSGFSRYYILRNGKPIAMTTDTRYEDRLAAGRPVYQIMGVYGKDNDYYVLSRQVPIEIPIKDTILVDVDTNQVHCLRLHRDSPPVLRRTVTAAVEYRQYAGRPLPVPDQAESRTEGLTLEYTVQHTELGRLYSMVGHTVCVKQRDGSATFAVLEDIQVNLWKRADVALQLTRVDYREVIEYV